MRTATPAAATLTAAILVLASCQAAPFEGARYGEPLTLAELTPISAIFAAPDVTGRDLVAVVSGLLDLRAD